MSEMNHGRDLEQRDVGILQSTIEAHLQTIARLEGEASGLRQARTILIADRERLQGELAASREKMECGHSKMFWYVGWEEPGCCTMCSALAATRADALLAACATICVNCDIKTPLSDGKNGMHLGGLHCYAWPVRKLVTPSDAAAREEWIRRIRLEVMAPFSDLAVEMEKHSNDHIHSLEETERGQAAVEGVCADRINAILKRLRAPVPAARAGDANELRYCGRCNQRRNFKDGKCEMCALQDSRDRRINAEDGDHYETEREGDAEGQK